MAVQLATLNPARALGLDGTLGRVEVGGVADLAIVDEDWRVQTTIAGGAVAYLGETGAASADPAR